MATLRHSAHRTHPMASSTVMGTPQTPGTLTIGGREVNGNSEIQLRPLGGERGRLPAPRHRDTIPSSSPTVLVFPCPDPLPGLPLPQPAPHSPMPPFCIYFPAPLPPCHPQAAPLLSPLSLPETLNHGGSQGARGLLAPHSPAPYVVNEGELRLNGEREQCHLWAQGIRSGTHSRWSITSPGRQEVQELPSPTHSARIHIFLLLAFLPGIQHLRAWGWVSPSMEYTLLSP